MRVSREHYTMNKHGEMHQLEFEEFIIDADHWETLTEEAQIKIMAGWRDEYHKEDDGKKVFTIHPQEVEDFVYWIKQHKKISDNVNADYDGI